jgi:hypothetical protein
MVWHQNFAIKMKSESVGQKLSPWESISQTSELASSLSPFNNPHPLIYNHSLNHETAPLNAASFASLTSCTVRSPLTLKP